MATTRTTRTEKTKHERRVLGSARVTRVWRARLAIANFSSELDLVLWRTFERKRVSAGRRKQTRVTRALPRINRRRRRIRLRAKGRRNGCRTWARLAWLASETCPPLLRVPESNTCLSQDRQCQNKEALSDRASRSTTILTNDPADRGVAAGRIFQRAPDSDSP